MQIEHKINCTINSTLGFVGFIVQVILAASCILGSRSAGGDFEDGVPRGGIKKGVPFFGTPFPIHLFLRFTPTADSPQRGSLSG